jgi:hypothetical protein
MQLAAHVLACFVLKLGLDLVIGWRPADSMHSRLSGALCMLAVPQLPNSFLGCSVWCMLVSEAGGAVCSTDTLLQRVLCASAGAHA